jgi:hypothetical protein
MNRDYEVGSSALSLHLAEWQVSVLALSMSSITKDTPYLQMLKQGQQYGNRGKSLFFQYAVEM